MSNAVDLVRGSDWAEVTLGLPGCTQGPEPAGPPCIGPDFAEAVLLHMLALSSDPVNPYRHARLLWDCGSLNRREVLYLVGVRQDYTVAAFLVDRDEFQRQVKAAQVRLAANGVGQGWAEVAEEVRACPGAMARHDFGGLEMIHAD